MKNHRHGIACQAAAAGKMEIMNRNATPHDQKGLKT
jgi:hypothetical protein